MLKKPPILGSDRVPLVSEHARHASFLHLCSLARSEADAKRRETYYTQALSVLEGTTMSSGTPELLLGVADCFYQLRRYMPALEALGNGASRGWELPEHCELRGRCLFKLGEFERALAAFQAAVDMGVNTRENQTWMMRCRAKLTMETDAAAAKERLIMMEEPVVDKSIRHDWYQSNTHVNLVVYVSGLREDQVSATYEPTSVDLVINGDHLHFDFEKEINPQDARILIGKTKVEVRMAKAAPGRWRLDKC